MTENQGTNLIQEIEGDFAKAAKAEHDVLRKELEEAASHNTEPVGIYTGGLVVIALAIAVGLFCIGVVVRGGDSMGQIILCLVVAVLLLGYALLNLLKWNKPAMILTANGIQLPGMDAPLPWTAVSGYSVVTGYALGHIGIHLFRVSTNISIILEDGIAQPAISGDWRVRYMPAVPKLNVTHRITIRLFSIRGISETRFDEIFSGYAHSGKARAALKDMLANS